MNQTIKVIRLERKGRTQTIVSRPGYATYTKQIGDGILFADGSITPWTVRRIVETTEENPTEIVTELSR